MSKILNLLISIDDTDTLDSKGTGTIADEIREVISKEYNGKCGYVTRHQLLIHKDIPYTSHNSCMCFSCNIEEADFELVKNTCLEYLIKESAIGSDPGIAVADIEKVDGSKLVTYGFDAKRRILTKNEAYEIAEMSGVWLREAGGTGDGVIGALAGIGLRIWGNDGDLKGKLATLKKETTYTVSEILATGYIEDVVDEVGEALSKDESVYILWKAKPTLNKNRLTLYVRRNEKGEWSSMEKNEMRSFLGNRVFMEGCEYFIEDVEEEQVDSSHSCFNCRYRRWQEKGLLCQRKS